MMKPLTKKFVTKQLGSIFVIVDCGNKPVNMRKNSQAFSLSIIRKSGTVTVRCPSSIVCVKIHSMKV